MPESLGPAAWFKVHDHQYLEIYQSLTSESEDRLIEVAFQTADDKGMRDYHVSKGAEVPASVVKGCDGNLSFQASDPEGQRLFQASSLASSCPNSHLGANVSTKCGTAARPAFPLTGLVVIRNARYLDGVAHIPRRDFDAGAGATIEVTGGGVGREG